MNSKIDSAVPIDQNGRKVIYTGVEVYVEVLDVLHSWMRANGMSMVLETDPRQEPQSPSSRTIRIVERGAG